MDEFEKNLPKHVKENLELIAQWKSKQASKEVKARNAYKKYWKDLGETEEKSQDSQKEEKKRMRREKKAKTVPIAELSPPAEDPENEKGRPWTISVAIPGLAISNIESVELQTYVCGQIARALTVFNVDEVIIYDDRLEKPEDGSYDPLMLRMARILQYLECPQYLRKFLFPVHDDLKCAGLLNPLDAPHHLRKHELSTYREGVVVSKGKEGTNTFACVGTHDNALLDHKVPPGTRVTVRIKNRNVFAMPRGTPVHHTEPRVVAGTYWGYTVRLTHSLSEVFSQSPYPDGYDCTLGGHSTGQPIPNIKLPADFRHMLYVVPGERDLTQLLAEDDKLVVKNPEDLFDICINPNGFLKSEAIRLEETLLVTLGALRPKIQQSKSK